MEMKTRPEGVLIERPLGEDDTKHVNGNYADPIDDEDDEDDEDDLVLGDEDEVEGDE